MMKRPTNLSYLQLVLIIIVNVTSWRWKSTKCAIWNFFSEEEDKIACNCHENTGRKSSKMFCRAWNSWKKMRLSKSWSLTVTFSLGESLGRQNLETTKWWPICAVGLIGDFVVISPTTIYYSERFYDEHVYCGKQCQKVCHNKISSSWRLREKACLI